MVNRPTIVMVDPRYIALQAEIVNHPELLEKMAKVQPRMAAKLACIAEYLGVSLDMILTVDEIHRMMEMFTKALIKKREHMVLTSSIYVPPGAQIH